MNVTGYIKEVWRDSKSRHSTKTGEEEDGVWTWCPVEKATFTETRRELRILMRAGT